MLEIKKVLSSIIENVPLSQVTATPALPRCLFVPCFYYSFLVYLFVCSSCSDLSKVPKALDTTSMETANEVDKGTGRQVDVAKGAAAAAVDDADVAAAGALGVEEGGGDCDDVFVVVVEPAAGAEAGVVVGDVAGVGAEEEEEDGCEGDHFEEIWD